MEINSQNLILTFVTSFFFTAFFVFFHNFIKIYIKSPDGPQKINEGTIPRLGGLSIFLTLFIFVLYNSSLENYLFLKFSIISFPVFIFGLFEDITQSISPKLRLLGSFLSGVLFILILESTIKSVGIFFIDNFLTYELASILFTIICIVYLIQAFNIIDGLNGLSLLSAILMLLSISYISYNLEDKQIFQFSIYFVCSLLGVLFFNFPFGKIFIGDAGAYIIGLFIAICAIILFDNNKNLSPFVIVQILIFPSYELLRSIIRRILTHKSILKPDKKHLHSLLYRFNKIGMNWSALKLNSYTSFQIICIQVLNFIFIINFFNNQTLIILGIIIFIFLYEMLYLLLGFKISKHRS
jgi:UDP-N-acetylmuramyl pentapeptide phosphotransferase/UDP-N-acetylglucosamine-1-phosphate transferase